VTVSNDGKRWFDEGQEWLRRRCVHKALACFNRAERTGFACTECAGARWQCWMLLGEFERAWAESDFITASNTYDPHRMWNGQAWTNQRVMLRCLHGLGDAIQFIRYAPLLRSTCRHLTVQTHPQLVSLLQGVRGIDKVVTWGSDWSDSSEAWDMQIEVTELPRAFRSTQSTLPTDVPYIQIPPELVMQARRFLAKSEGLRVGVSWQAGSWSPGRSATLEVLAEIFGVNGVRFYSLQKGATREDIRPARVLRELETYARDVRDTAAMILNLDLVITVDTMTAHLAGALGRPVWIMLPRQADWRWMLSRDDTPWYPTARLFRQKQENCWASVVADVARSLEDEAASLSPLTRLDHTLSGR